MPRTGAPVRQRLQRDRKPCDPWGSHQQLPTPGETEAQGAALWFSHRSFPTRHHREGEVPHSTLAPPVSQMCPAVPGGRVAAGRPVGARTWYLALGTGFTAATTSLGPCEARRGCGQRQGHPQPGQGDTGVATSLPQLVAPGLLRAAPSGSAWLHRGGPASSRRACC